jgi:hypothetical protein
MDQVRAEVDLTGIGADAEERDAALRSLQRALLELDEVSSATPVATGEVPSGAKGDVGLATSLAVSLLSGSVPAMLAVVAGWRHRHDGRCTVRLPGPDGATIEFNDLNPDDIPAVMARWKAIPPAAEELSE